MTDRRELEALIAKACRAGATVTVQHDSDGYIDSIAVAGLRGVGPFPMSPLSFAERMRERLSNFKG